MGIVLDLFFNGFDVCECDIVNVLMFIIVIFIGDDLILGFMCIF